MRRGEVKVKPATHANATHLAVALLHRLVMLHHAPARDTEARTPLPWSALEQPPSQQLVAHRDTPSVIGSKRRSTATAPCAQAEQAIA